MRVAPARRRVRCAQGGRRPSGKRHRLARRDPPDRHPDRRCRAAAGVRSGRHGPAGALRRAGARADLQHARRHRREADHRDRGPEAQRRRGQPQPHHRRGRPWWAQPGPGGARLVRQRGQRRPQGFGVPARQDGGADPSGQPGAVPDLGAGGRDRGAGTPGLPGEGGRAGRPRRLAVARAARGGRRDRGGGRPSDTRRPSAGRRALVDQGRLDGHASRTPDWARRAARRSPRRPPTTAPAPASGSRSSTSRRPPSTSTSTSRTSVGPRPA